MPKSTVRVTKSHGIMHKINALSLLCCELDYSWHWTKWTVLINGMWWIQTDISLPSVIIMSILHVIYFTSPSVNHIHLNPKCG